MRLPGIFFKSYEHALSARRFTTDHGSINHRARILCQLLTSWFGMVRPTADDGVNQIPAGSGIRPRDGLEWAEAKGQQRAPCRCCVRQPAGNIGMKGGYESIQK